jgi:hypothetical protein
MPRVARRADEGEEEVIFTPVRVVARVHLLEVAEAGGEGEVMDEVGEGRQVVFTRLF